jgi:hypothetical protein
VHPEWLVQFAQMGTTYARHRYGIESAEGRLLSIGEEPTKGTPLVKETHALLAAGEWSVVRAARSSATSRVETSCRPTSTWWSPTASPATSS